MIRFEFYKYFKNFKLRLVFLLTGILSIIFVRIYGEISGINKNAFSLVSQSLNFLAPFLPFLFTTLGAIAMASEFEYGTIRTILTGNISRNKVILIKISFLGLVSLTFSFVFIGLLTVSAVLGSPIEAIKAGGYTIVSESTLFIILISITILMAISLFIYSLLGMFFGILLRQSLSSVISGFALVISLNIFAVLPWVRNFIFSTYTFKPIDYFYNYARGMPMSLKWLPVFLGVNGVYGIILIFFTIFLFKKADI